MAETARPDRFEVRFRLTTGEVERLADSTTPPALKFVLYAVAGATLLVVGSSTFLGIRRAGFGAVLTGASGQLLLAMAFAVGFLAWQRWSIGRSPRPEVSVGIGPEGLLVRQEGLAELRRAWPGIVEVRDDGRMIAFVPEIVDASTGRRTRLDAEATVVPVRAFPSRAAADSFLEAARRWHAEARPEG